MSRRMLVVGNWKMNGLRAQLSEIAAIGALAGQHVEVEVGLCVPATLITAASEVAGAAFIGGQDCHAKANGAHTGCLSAAMVKEAGARQVIVGHSERRTDQHENSADVAAKALAAHAEGLGVILCLGETLETRDGDVGELVDEAHRVEVGGPGGQPGRADPLGDLLRGVIVGENEVAIGGEQGLVDLEPVAGATVDKQFKHLSPKGR